METNLEKVKEIVKAFLDYPITFKSGPFGPIIQHPVFKDRIISIPTPKTKENQVGLRLLDLTIPENQDVAIEYYNSLINDAENVFHIFLIINNLYAGFFLKILSDYLSVEDFSQILEHTWVALEYPNADKNVSKRDWVKLWKKANLDYVYSDEDKEFVKQLPDEFTVYRGLMNKASVKALSWTLDKDKAIWFAKRFNYNGKVYKATCKKKDMLVYLSGRNESEVVVDYKKLTNVEEVSY